MTSLEEALGLTEAQPESGRSLESGLGIDEQTLKSTSKSNLPGTSAGQGGAIGAILGPVDTQPIPEGLQPSSVLNELTRPVRKVGSEMYQGIKNLVYQPQGDPNTFDKFMKNFADISPEASQKYISTPAGHIGGLLRLLGALPTAAGNELGILNQRIRDVAGMPQNPQGDLLMNLVGALATPSGIANLPVNAATTLSRVTLRPMMRAITKAENLGAENTAINAASATKLAAAEARSLEAHNQLAKSTAELDVAMNQLAQRQGLQVTSPFGASLAAPLTNKQAYSFMEALKPGSVPNVPLVNMQREAEAIIKKFSGLPQSLQPTGKGIKAAEELAGAGAGADIARSNPGLALTDLSEAQREIYVKALATIKGHNKVGGLALDNLQAFKDGVGNIINVTSSSEIGKRLYFGLMEDLRAAAQTSPGAALAYKANIMAGQNFAARDIAKSITFNGTTVDKFGQLHIQPNTLRKKMEADDFLKQIPVEKRNEVADTLEEIFRANRGIRSATGEIKKADAEVKAGQIPGLPEIITPTIKAGVVSRTLARGAGAIAGGAIGAMTGIPYAGYGGAVSGAFAGGQIVERLPQLILQAALRPGGTRFLKTIFADMPPMVGDVGKAAAIQNFIMQSER